MAYTQAMTFAEIVMEVQQLRFSAANSSSIQRWVNHRYAALWNADEWIFKYGQANVTVTNGSSQLSNLPADFGISIGLWRADGCPLRWQPPRDYFDIYQGAQDLGAPQFFTIIDQSIFVGPISNESSDQYLLAYEKRLTPLVNDTDVPAIPPQHHYLLVTGALAFGMAHFNDFTYQFLESEWQQGIAEMRQEWLADQRGEVGVWGRDSVEALPTSWGI